VPVGAKVADVGTDHAYLPIALAKAGKAKSIIACDIKEKPLEKARENIEKFGVFGIETRLGDGISPIKEGEADTVIIAGMGGDVITHILSNCPWIKNSGVFLMLQPMTGAEVLRSFLNSNLFCIEKEIPLVDAGEVYSVMLVRFSGIKENLPSGFEFSGKVSAKTKEGRLYLEKQRKRILDCVNSLSKTKGKEAEANYYTEILNHLNTLLGV
jgi:tRNA (adenine22-N1)-methyltransferase